MSSKKESRLHRNDEIVNLGKSIAGVITLEDGTVKAPSDVYYHGVETATLETLQAAVKLVESHDAKQIPAIAFGVGDFVLGQMVEGTLDSKAMVTTKVQLTPARSMTIGLSGVVEGDDGDKNEFGVTRVSIHTKHVGTRGDTGMAHAFDSLAAMAENHFGPEKTTN
jgi:hypothetical protein